MSIKSRLQKLEEQRGAGDDRPLVVRIRWIDAAGDEIQMPDWSGGKPTPEMRLPPDKPNVRYIQVKRPPAERTIQLEQSD